MSKLKFTTVEERATPTGKKLKKCSVEKEGMQFPFNGVTVWEDHPDYEQVAVGFETDSSYIHEVNSETPNPNKPGSFYKNRTLKVSNGPNAQTHPLVNAKLSELNNRLKILEEKILGDAGSNEEWFDNQGPKEAPKVSTNVEIKPEDIPF